MEIRNELLNENADRAKLILTTLKNVFSIPNPADICIDPFSLLVRTIISQSTSEKNVRKAYENLKSKMPVTPKNLAEAKIEDIENSLRVAGLYRNKSIVLKRVASEIIERFDGSLDFIYLLPLHEAREKLMGLPGVGPKTADIILLFCAGRPVLPVDTHVNRVSRRLGLFPQSKGGYESVRARLEEIYDPKDYFAVHMLFISLGRSFCKALRPLCHTCPVNAMCPSASFIGSLQ
ncbi:MAG: endonuclease III [Candidatus Bathyarchaeia archaeon]|nr:endonuclease III [Candidatus Bathyarchaeota archaeon]